MNLISNIASYLYHDRPVEFTCCVAGIVIPLAFIIMGSIGTQFEDSPDGRILNYKGKSTFIEDSNDSNKKYEVYEKYSAGISLKYYLFGLIEAVQTYYVQYWMFLYVIAHLAGLG